MILDTIDDDIKTCEMWAHYWIAMAITKVGLNRNIQRGDGTPFTDEEKIEDCMMTANNHLHRMSELIDRKKALIVKYDAAGARIS